MSLESALAKYPRLGGRSRLPDFTKKKCKVCGQPAMFTLTVQVNFFRGDDEVYPVCFKHKSHIKEGL